MPGLSPTGRAAAKGKTIEPARPVGLRPGTERYEEALWALVWGGALTVNDCVPLEVAARLPFGRAPYRLAPAAIGLLEMA